MPARFTADQLYRLIDLPRFLVRPLRQQGVEHIGERDDACLERDVVAAQAALDAGASDREFYEAKLATGRYYMKRQLPATALHLARIQSGADPVMTLEAANF